MGYRRYKQKPSPGLLFRSHMSSTAIGLASAPSGGLNVDCKFIARFSDFANISDKIFDLETDGAYERSHSARAPR
jgi:hypothetical protein